MSGAFLSIPVSLLLGQLGKNALIEHFILWFLDFSAWVYPIWRTLIMFTKMRQLKDETTPHRQAFSPCYTKSHAEP